MSGQIAIDAPMRENPSLDRPLIATNVSRRSSNLLVRWAGLVFWFLVAAIVRIWQFACLVLLLSIAASLPILQLASLGYLLESSGRWARGRPFRECLPGLKLAGSIGTVAFWIALSSVPVYLVRDLAASSNLIAPDTSLASRWQIGAAIIGVTWCLYVSWALLRGGRLWHFLWPAPVRFVREFFHVRTWQTAADNLQAVVGQFRFITLMKLGFFGSIGALIYLIIPGAIILAGIHAPRDGAKAILTLVGIIAMLVMLQYLPFLQMRYAQTGRFRSFLEISAVRRGFQRAPWLHAIAMLLLVVLAIPLYLLRIEAPPSQLVWTLCVFFVLFNIPAKFMLAWAVRYSEQRTKKRAWYNRYPAWLLMIASLPIYILFLYLATLASWDGSAVVIVQHAFLLPVPFLSP